MHENIHNDSRIQCVSKADPGYPSRLKELPGMPGYLYLIGRFPEDNKPTVGIVGARQASHYGRDRPSPACRPEEIPASLLPLQPVLKSCFGSLPFMRVTADRKSVV